MSRSVHILGFSLGVEGAVSLNVAAIHLTAITSPTVIAARLDSDTA